MRRNIVKQRVVNGETVVGTMINEVTTPAIAQIFKQVGFDFFMIDMEHGAFSLETAAHIIRVARMLDLCPVVRVRSPEYHLIAGALDQGAMGIMLPRVETRQDVETLVSCMKYPPVGIRGFSSDAAHSEYDFGPTEEFIEALNQDTLVIVQIERKVAVERLDELLSVPGVDVALIGPEDLSVSLGVPGQTNHPLVAEAMDQVVEACQRHGVAAGFHQMSAGPLLEWHARGMRFLMLSNDLGFLMESSAAGVRELKKGLGTRG